MKAVRLLYLRRCSLGHIMRRKMLAFLNLPLGFAELAKIIMLRISRRPLVSMKSLFSACFCQRLFSSLYCEIQISLGFSLNFIFSLSFVLPLILNPTL